MSVKGVPIPSVSSVFILPIPYVQTLVSVLLLRWITGDQHVSNFGAWRNRHGAIVFGINDFDEAVVYDFQIDIWRLAVSMYF